MNSSLRKTLQITEEAQIPIHMPVQIGNDLYVVTQQDHRKIEEVRVFTYSKLMPNGDLKPLDSLPDNFVLSRFRSLFDGSHIQNNCMDTQNLLLNNNGAVLSALLDVLKHQINHPQQQQAEMEWESSPHSGESNNAQGRVNQQLNWDKSTSFTKPFNFTLSNSTSTTDLMTSKDDNRQDLKENQSKTCCPHCEACQNRNKKNKRCPHFQTHKYSKTIQTDHMTNCHNRMVQTKLDDFYKKV